MTTFTALPGLTLHEGFLDAEAQAALTSELSARPAQWKRLRGRELQNWGGLPHARGMVAVPLPPFLASLSKELVARGIFPSSETANHVLVNRYAAGEGILAHTDGPAYVPRAAILSLDERIMMDFTGAGPAPEGVPGADAGSSRVRVGSLWLNPGSLLVLEGKAYSDLHHGIAPRVEDTVDELVFNAREKLGTIVARPSSRTSLTFRRAAKTIQNPLRLSRR